MIFTKPSHHRGLVLWLCIVQLFSLSCLDPTDYDLDETNNQLELSPATATIPADGASSVRFDVKVPSTAKTDHRTVALTTSLGTFAQGGKADATVDTDVAGSGYVNLVSPVLAGTATVRAKVGSFVREASVTFSPALATSVEVQPAKFFAKGSVTEELEVTAALRRAVGVPSTGAHVQFRALTIDGDSIGRFSSAPSSDANGKVKVSFTTGTTSYRGMIRIIAQTLGESNAVITGENVVEVINP